jgi:phage terminase large subunit
MNIRTRAYIELYKQKQFDKIPVCQDDTGIYFLSQKQIQSLQILTNHTTKQLGLGGSARCGKSVTLCFWQIMNRLAYPGTRGFIGRKELKNLGLTTGKTLFNMLKFYELIDKIDYNYNQQKQVITFENKSELLLMDTAYAPSDPLFTCFGGLELTDAGIDESNETSIEAINIILSRTGWCNNEKYGLPRKTLETFNPEKNHVYRRYWKPYRDNKETNETKFIKALPTDNPHPAVKQWIEDIIKLGDKRMIQRLIYGNFDYDDDDNSLCNYDKILDIFTNSFVDKNDKGELIPKQNFMSCDIAISNDYFVVVNWSGLIIKEIIRIRNISPTQINVQSDGMVNNKIDFDPLLKILKHQSEKWKVPRSNIVYDADGIGHFLRDLLPGAVALNNNSKAYGQEYTNLKCQLEYKLAMMINNAEIYCEANLNSDLKEVMITELQMIKRSTEPGQKLATMKKAEIKELLGHSPDIMDAIKYRLLFLISRNV